MAVESISSSGDRALSLSLMGGSLSLSLSENGLKVK